MNAGSLLLAGLACVALVGALLVGGTLTLAAVTGVAVLVAILAFPLVGLALTIVAPVLTPLLGAVDVSGVGVTLTRPLGAVTVVSWFFWAVRRRVPLTIAPQMIPLAGVVGVMALSVALAPDREQSLIGAYRLLAVLVLYLLVANIAIDRPRLLAVGAMIAAMATVSAVIALVQYTVPSFAVIPDDPGRSRLDFGEGAIVDADSLSSGAIRRVTGGTGEPLFLAQLMVAAIPLDVFWWRASPRLAVKALALVMGVLHLVGLVLTYSRAGILSLVFVVGYLAIRRQANRLAVAALVPVAVVLALWLAPPGFIERMVSLEYLREGSTSIRRDLYTHAADMITRGGLLGHGFGQFGPSLLRESNAEWVRETAQTVAPDDPEIHNIMPHNLLAEIGVEYGWLGLIAFVAFFVATFRDLRQAERAANPPERDLAIAIGAGLLAFQLGGLLAHGKLLKIFWLLAGMTVALRRVVFTRPTGPAATVAPLRGAVRT